MFAGELTVLGIACWVYPNSILADVATALTSAHNGSQSLFLTAVFFFVQRCAAGLAGALGVFVQRRICCGAAAAELYWAGTRGNRMALRAHWAILVQ